MTQPRNAGGLPFDPDRATRDPYDGPGPADDSGDLPPQVGRHVTNVHRQPADQGSQATLYRGRWGDNDMAHGVDVAIKAYSENHRPDQNLRDIQDIWQWWRDRPSQYVVPLMFADRVGERNYEITRWQLGGNLSRFNGRPMQHNDLWEVLRQLTDVMRACQDPVSLHGRTIIHRDIKPTNVLLTSVNPLVLSVADWGSAHITSYDETSVVLSDAGITDRYAAPEAGMDITSTAFDWFSIGVTLLELACGAYPFPESGAYLRNLLRDPANYAGRGQSVDVVAQVRAWPGAALEGHDRWALLLGGLLTHPYRQRWGLKEVEAWLNGEDPPLRDEHVYVAPPLHGQPAQQPRGPGFQFFDTVYHRPVDVANAMREHWDPHAGALVVGAELAALAKWAGQFDPTMEPRLVRTAELNPPDRAVAYATTVLDPTGPPVFYSFPLYGPPDRPWLGLVELASRAAQENAPERETEGVVRLWESGALLELAELRGCRFLGRIQQIWADLVNGLRIAATMVPQDDDGPDFGEYHERLLAMMLRAAVDDRYANWLRRTALSSRYGVWTTSHRRVGWFAALERATHVPYTGELLEQAPAFYAVMILSAPLLRDIEARVRPDAMRRAEAEMQRTIAQIDAEISAGSPRLRRRSLRQWFAELPPEQRIRLVVGTVATGIYLCLITLAAAGVGTETTAQEGWLTAGMLAMVTAWVPISLRLREGRVRRALLGGWLGAVVGLPVAAALGACAHYVDMGTAWPAFWVGWVIMIFTGAAWGAAE